MKALKYFYITLIVLSAVLLNACEEKIELHVPDHQLNILVVNGMITSDTTAHEVRLSLTGSFYLNQETARATGAQVSIIDNQGNHFPLTELGPGIYQTQPHVYGSIGTTYTLQIQYNGQYYESSSTMQRNSPIDSLSYRWDAALGYYRILLYGQELQGKGDCYMWHIYRNDTLVTNDISKVLATDDRFIDGNYISGFEVDWWAHEFNFLKGDHIRVAQHSLTREAFDFIMAVSMERTGGNGGMRPPANIASNISNGALGLFHASAVSYARVKLE